MVVIPDKFHSAFPGLGLDGPLDALYQSLVNRILHDLSRGRRPILLGVGSHPGRERQGRLATSCLLSCSVYRSS